MRTAKDHFAGIQWGLSVWSGSAKHLGRSYAYSEANLPIKAAQFSKRIGEFFDADVDVWTIDGWLVTSCTLGRGVVRCSVRKGTQVATLVTPDESLFFHAAKALHRE
ncbi:hypothetical protein D3C78_1265890 [compost metagenome]